MFVQQNKRMDYHSMNTKKCYSILLTKHDVKNISKTMRTRIL